jgi:hypothetical protein
MRKDLRVIVSVKNLFALNLDYDLSVHDQISPETTIQPDGLINERHRLLALDANPQPLDLIC